MTGKLGALCTFIGLSGRACCPKPEGCADSSGSKHYKDPTRFMPDRYLGAAEGSGSGTDHFGFGAGSRMCAGSHLANRELYTAFLRLIVAFEFVECQNASERPILDPLGCNEQPTSLTIDPRPFKMGFKARDPVQLRQWLAASEERTKDF